MAAPREADRPNEVNEATWNAAVFSGMSCGYFRAGPGYRTTRPHGRSDWLILLTRAGAGLARGAGGEVRLGPRTLAIYLADAAQDYGTCPVAGAWTFAFSHVSPRPAWARLVATWPSPTQAPGLAVLGLADVAIWQRVWSAMEEARRLIAAPYRDREALTINALERALLWAEAENPARGPAVDPRVRRAAELARVRVDRPLTADDLAEAAGLSVSRLTALFRAQLGESPVRFAERLRLEHAATLIAAGGLSVTEAAAACGYDDPFHFSRRFKQRIGRPPSYYHRDATPDPAPPPSILPS